MTSKLAQRITGVLKENADKPLQEQAAEVVRFLVVKERAPDMRLEAAYFFAAIRRATHIKTNPFMRHHDVAEFGYENARKLAAIGLSAGPEGALEEYREKVRGYSRNWRRSNGVSERVSRDTPEAAE